MTAFNQPGALGYGLGQANQAFYNNSLSAADQAAAQAALNAYCAGISAQIAWYNTNRPAPPENTGIEVGEIVAWRAWKKTALGALRSYTMDTAWPPNEVMEADSVDDIHGIYAFKTERDALTCFQSDGVVIGSVHLWGEIWEFEKGYHAEFAKIISLDWPKRQLRPRGLLRRLRWFDPLYELREMYGLYDDAEAALKAWGVA